MNSLKLRRPRHATVVAYLSLFLVVSGGAAVAAGKIGSSQLKRNAVTAPKIKKGAVTSTKLGSGAVTQGKLADSAISTGKLQDRAVTGAKIADNAVGGAQADEASFQGLVKGSGSQQSHSFTVNSVGFLPTPLTLAEIPSLGARVELLFCGSFESSSKDQMRVRVRALSGAAAFVAVNKVEASNLPVGTKQPEFVDFGGGSFADDGGEPLLAELPEGAVPGPFGIVAKWDFQLFRGDDPNTTTAHVSVSAWNDSNPVNKNGQCHVTAETIAQP